jgi:hypothetical protein
MAWNNEKYVADISTTTDKTSHYLPEGWDPTMWQPKTEDMIEDYKKLMKAKVQKPEKRKEKKMAKKTRGLYQVILVDPKEGKIIFNEFVICSKPEDVLLEAGAGEVIKDKGLQVSEVDKILNYLGEIRRTKKNKDGIVELVEEKEDN